MITAPQILETLWQKGFFESPKSLLETKNKFHELKHFHSDQNINGALSKAPFLTPRIIKKKKHYAQKHASNAITLKDGFFPKELVQVLGKSFALELDDLKLNFGRSGTCTAFLLRKILEKLIYIVMTKNQLGDLLVSDKTTGKLFGLEAMLEIISKQKTTAGKHFLMPKTSENIKGIKFLGDSAAHNPLTNVNMDTIIPVMPYIVTAFQELAVNL